MRNKFSLMCTAAALLDGLCRAGCLRNSADEILPPRVEGQPQDCPRCRGKESTCCFTNKSPIVRENHCCCTRNMIRKIEDGLSRLREVQKYLGQPIAVAFNGGKDSLAALHLWRLVLLESRKKFPLILVYFRTPGDFPEMQEFVQATARECNADLRVSDGDYKDQVANVIADLKRELPMQTDNEWTDYAPVAFIIGLRGQDDSCNQTWKEKSTVGPVFWRIHPLINWSYGDVWTFLRLIKAKTCGIYDQGFSSVGRVGKTKPNPALLNPDGTYKPAYMLSNWETERCTRS